MSKVDIERVLTQGNPDGLTQEQIKQAIDDTVKGFTTIADLNNFLTKLHPSDDTHLFVMLFSQKVTS